MAIAIRPFWPGNRREPRGSTSRSNTLSGHKTLIRHVGRVLLFGPGGSPRQDPPYACGGSSLATGTLSLVEPLTTPYDRERLEDVGFMTCMTLVLLGNYAQTGHFGGPLAYAPY